MNYDVNYFIMKFQAIPEGDWGRANLEDHCVLYHCGLTNYQYVHTPESIALAKLFGAKEPMYDKGGYSINMEYVWEINDGIGEYYLLGKTPKERILNKLYQIRDGICF